MTAVGINVLIADDHALIREGLKRILLDGKIARHIGEAAGAPEAVAAARERAWDLVILDVNLGGGSGLDVLKDLTAHQPRVPVLMLSMYPEEQFAVRAIRAGAAGYLNKNQAPVALLDAVRKVLAGGRYVSDKVAEQLISAVKQPVGKAPHEALSLREDQVLRLIGSGRTVSEIAALLNLSVKTVSTYRARILEKLAIRNNAQIILYAHEHGLLE